MVAFLLGGVLVVVWPIGLARRRWTMRTAPTPAPRSLSAFVPVRTMCALAVRHPRRTVAGTVVAAAVIGWSASGPVAAAALGTYTGLAARTVLRRRRHRDRAGTRARELDELGALAADLRAGLPPADLAPTDLAAAGPAQVGLRPDGSGGTASSRTGTAGPASPDDSRLRDLTAAVWRLAERTGAPVADLVDRIEADGRAADRGRAAAAAHAAGARATALLLAGLPAGGIALGYAIGVDPLRVLLHTPLGAACVAGALILQLGGLAWADRLAGAGADR